MSDAGPAPTALVTGASSGIGYHLARLFARDRYRVVLVARNARQLDAVAAECRTASGQDAVVIVKDLSVPTAPQEIAEELAARSIRAQVLVNNAGFGSHGPFAQNDLPNELRMLQVNVVALTHLTGLLVRPMLERREGKILNVASTAAFQAGPLMAVYYASKAYVLSFSDALRVELEGTGVSVTVLCPGPTETNFQSRAGVTGSRLFRGRVMDAESGALAGYEGLLRGKAAVVPGLRNKILAQSARAAPRLLAARVARAFNRTSHAP